MFYKVILANSAMALVVIATLLLLHDQLLTAAVIVLGCGAVNALLVRAAFTLDAQRQQQRELFAWTLQQREAERSRVARELQDGAAQRLAALALRASADSAVSGEAAALMQELCDTAGTLEPPRMQLLGLGGALTWYADAVERRTGVPMHVSADLVLDRADTGSSTSVFRALEDVTETLARKPALRIDLAVAATDAVVTASIRAHSAQGAGSSLRFTDAERFRLSERVACLGGTFDVIHGDASAVVHLTLPLREHHVRHDSGAAG